MIISILIYPRSEDGGTHTNHRAAVLDGDVIVVARQLIDGLNMNKSFYLPARFAMIETANDPGEALALSGIESRVEAFAARIRQTLLFGTK